jgi:hypothetical protein
MDTFDPWNMSNCKRLAEKMFIRSQQTIPRCIGALDGMCVTITKPRESDVANPLHVGVAIGNAYGGAVVVVVVAGICPCNNIITILKAKNAHRILKGERQM